MVNPEVVATRLSKLREYLGYLKSLRKYSFRQFSGDPFIRGNVERYLQLAIEALQDRLADFEQFAKAIAKTLR